MCSYMYITTVSYAIWSVTACTLIECTEPAMAFKQVDDYTDIACSYCSYRLDSFVCSPTHIRLSCAYIAIAYTVATYNQSMTTNG